MIVVKPNTNHVTECTVDGVRYKFKVESTFSHGGYASIIIKDLTHGETYTSDGYIELNGHLFISTWSEGFQYPSGDLIYADNLVIRIV